MGLTASNLNIKIKIPCTHFLVIQLPVFAEATNPLEADNCLYTMESKFECVRRAGYPLVARDGAA
jgi:hypothetical protein